MRALVPLLLLFACTNKDKISASDDDSGTPDTETDTGEADADTDADSDADTDADADADTDSDVPDSRFAMFGIQGRATVDTDWVGTEWAYVYPWDGTTADSAVKLCEWTWTAGPGATAPAVPCEDDDGNACLFEWDIPMTGGQNTAGNCLLFLADAPTDGKIGYGYTNQFYYSGIDYGPALLYYNRDSGGWGDWSWATNRVTYNSTTKELTYDWPAYTFNY